MNIEPSKESVHKEMPHMVIPSIHHGILLGAGTRGDAMNHAAPNKFAIIQRSGTDFHSQELSIVLLRRKKLGVEVGGQVCSG
jgi:hypothetical protein